MLTIEGQEGRPTLWVGSSLRQFGINPYGDPLFRVVWAPSRTMLVGGKHTVRDGAVANDAQLAANNGRDNSVRHEWVGYKHYPRYPGVNEYVLEAWLSPVQYGGTPRQWELQQTDEETGLLVLGPYPQRGEYDVKWYFGQEYPTVSQVEKMIQVIFAGDRYTSAEKKAAMVEADKKAHLERVARNKDIILDALPGHGLNPSSSHPGKKRPEDYALRVSANDLGFPTQNNTIFTRRSR